MTTTKTYRIQDAQTHRPRFGVVETPVLGSEIIRCRTDTPEEARFIIKRLYIADKAEALSGEILILSKEATS